MAPEHFLHQRVAEELSHHPPFSELAGDGLLLLAEHVEVKYLGPKEWLFQQGDGLHEYIYVVVQGNIELLRGSDLVDHVDPGEMLGLRALFEQSTYRAGAKAVGNGDALLYAIPVELVKKILVENPETSHYFQLDWKGNREDFVPSGTSLRRLMKRESSSIVLPITEERQKLKHNPAVLAHESMLLREVVEMMNGAKTDAVVVVDEKNWPLGIITDKDIRRSLIRKDFSRKLPVTRYMSSPVFTFHPNISFANAVIAMMEHRIHHLVITKTGDANGAVLGIISDHDLLLEQALTPSIITKKMGRVQSSEELEALNDRIEVLRNNYLKADVSMELVLKIMTQFYEGLTNAAIRIVQLKIGPEPCAFTWLALGSLGRGEQVLRTDQDHALVYERPKCAPYFKQLAEGVSELLESIGFEPDHFGVSATSQMWSGTPGHWEERLIRWIQTPEEEAILRIGIVQDARAIAGQAEVAIPAFNKFYQALRSTESTLLILAKDALRNPSPLNVFKQIKLEEDGLFDLKLRAILPFIDAAKVLAAHSGNSHLANTRERLEQSKDGTNEELINSAQHAYEILLQLRLKFGLMNGDSGRYINPKSLDQLDRQLLRNVLKTLEALQGHLKLKFKL